MNDVAVRSYFDGQAPLALLPGDPEANPANFEGVAQVRYDPMEMPIFAGMVGQLTKNVNKETDFANGMTATVEAVYRSGVRVRTKTGYQLVIFPWTDEWRNTFNPMRVGYANTLLKMQGAAAWSHLTLWLDVAKVDAAGYVALSRVEYDANRRYVGNPGVQNFTPASGY